MTPTRPRRRPTPSNIGPYRILEELGRGGQGVVYLAQNSMEDRFAIKSVADEAPNDSPSVQRLRRESEFLAVLDHPNIARVQGPLLEADRLYMVMEYVEGKPLAERLRFGPLPRNEGFTVARQIASAVDAAHQARVAHRDLKPANIRITPDGVVKVLDFGVAAYTGHEENVAARDTAMVGTYGYMAPEQMMGAWVDHRADIWAFGCILFECLVGRALFAGASYDEFFLRVAGRDADLRALPDDTPRTVKALLKSCLVRHPGARLGAIAEAVAVLDAVLDRRLPPAQRVQPRTNLPRRHNTFVGRDREAAEIAAMLRETPAVAIIGPGGAGKTRLAMEIGARLVHEFREGCGSLTSRIGRRGRRLRRRSSKRSPLGWARGGRVMQRQRRMWSGSRGSSGVCRCCWCSISATCTQRAWRSCAG